MSITVVDGNGDTQSVETLPAVGRAAAAASLPAALSTEDLAALVDIATAVTALAGSEYETVAAGSSVQVLGASGASGDLLMSLLIVPASLSPGAVSIKDGSGSSITVFAGGSGSVATLHPFTVPLGIRSSSGAWQVTTGANVSAIAAGNFS